MEVRYTPGDGILVARGERWLLLGGPAPSIAVLDQLWDDLGQPSARALAVATVHRHLGGAPLAWLDSTGGTLAESGGVVAQHGDRFELSVGTASAATPLRLVEGIAAAGSVQVTGAVARPLGPSGRSGHRRHPARDPRCRAADAPAYGVTKEVTPEPGTVRRDPLSPAAAEPSPAVTGDSDHDRHTQVRARGPSTPVPEPSPLLEQTTADTVLAVRCRRGHLTDPLAGVCRGCGDLIPEQEPQRVLRPPLGVLQLPDGGVVPLDRPVVLGRRPSPSRPGEWPHLVTLPQDSTYLSRNHLRIDLDGWHVLAEDLASRGGTTIFAPGRDPERIRPHEPHLLEHGTTMDLAGAYRLTYLSTIPSTDEERM